MNDVVKTPEPPPSAPTLWTRLHAALGPIAGGLVLDFVDLVTFGPIGLAVGPIVGGIVGWWLCSFYRLTGATRLLAIVAAGVYCFIPFTEPFPLATIVAAMGRFVNPHAPEPSPPDAADSE
jgi:hypothetical protein